LQARGLEIKERIYRPFLVFVIHQELSGLEHDALSIFVQEHIATCSRLIQHWNIKYRHHGTWLMVRQSFSSALLLLAAQKAGLAEVQEIPLKETLQLTLRTLRYWEKEAPDLGVSRLILESIMQELGLLSVLS
jgi:hypothetical protein